MHSTDRKKQLGSLFNLPNQLTSLRLILAMVMFAAIDLQWYQTAFVLFVVATSTDWLDGYFARKYGQVTTLGRILDPFADKFIICGTFIYLLSIPRLITVPQGLRTWMVVVIVGRELLVTAVRSFLEHRGSDFSAKFSGKLKMVLQCIAAGAGLFVMCCPSQPISLYFGSTPHEDWQHWWVWWVLVGTTWSAVVLTAYSGVVYVGVAIRLLRAP